MERNQDGRYPHLTEYISLRRVAELLEMDRTTARRILREADVSAFKFGGSVRYRKADVDKFLGTCWERPDAAPQRE